MIKELKLFDVVTANDEDSIVDVAKLIKERRVRHVYVIDSDRKPVGVISTVDISNNIVAMEKDYSGLKAKDVMNKPVDHVDINQEVEYAMKIMMSRKTYSCLVTQDGAIKGVIDYKQVMDKIVQKIRG